MKYFIACLLLISLITSQVIKGQFFNITLNTKFKGKVIKPVKDQSIKLKTSGWDVFEDYMLIDERLQTTWIIENEANADGSAKYVNDEAKTLDVDRNKAYHQAIDWAKLKIAYQAVSTNISFMEPLPERIEEKYIFTEYLDKVSPDVLKLFNILKNINHDYMFKISKTTTTGVEVNVKVFFDALRMKVYAVYMKDITAEMDKSQLFGIKDEFESQNTYIDRKNKAIKFDEQIVTRYKALYSARPKEIPAGDNVSKNEKIKNSYEKIVLTIENIGQYNPENQTLPITINNITENIPIIPEQARRIKQNQQNLIVSADKQLTLDGSTSEIFNIQITDPDSKANFNFGKQKIPLFIDKREKAKDKANNKVQDKTFIDKTIKDKNQTTENEEQFTNTTSKPEKFQPPLIKIEGVKFREENNDNRINANEKVYIDFSLKNYGKGMATDLNAKIKMNGDTAGIRIEPLQDGGTLTPNGVKAFTVPISATMNMTRGKVTFTILVKEKNGFDADPVEIGVNTLEFQKPQVAIADYEFKTITGEPLKPGIVANLKLIIQNVGQGAADEVNTYIGVPKVNVFNVDESSFTIGTLRSGESREINYQFVANKNYPYQNIPIKITLSEKYRLFAEEKTIVAPLSVDPAAIEKLDVVSEKFLEKVIEKASLTPDVDKNIPENPVKKENTYVLIIGNEDYAAQFNDENKDINSVYSVNDAKIFKEYITRTIGVPDKNIKMILNGTIAEMNQGVAELGTYAKVFRENAELIFYYSGHGIADEKTKEGFLIPVDGGMDLKFALKVNDIYQKLTDYKTRKVTVFMDACFSGSARSKSLFSNKGNIKIVFGANQLRGNLVEFAACSGDQTAQALREKQHGLFSYYLLKKIQTSQGNVSYKELADFINENIKNESLSLTGNLQTPKTNLSTDIEASWQGWRLK